MLKLCIIPNKEKFMRCVYKSEGDVYLHLPNGSKCNLKTDTQAANMFKMMDVSKFGIDLSFSKPTDMPRFLKYMMEAGRTVN